MSVADDGSDEGFNGGAEGLFVDGRGDADEGFVGFAGGVDAGADEGLGALAAEFDDAGVGDGIAVADGLEIGADIPVVGPGRGRPAGDGGGGREIFVGQSAGFGAIQIHIDQIA